MACLRAQAWSHWCFSWSPYEAQAAKKVDALGSRHACRHSPVGTDDVEAQAEDAAAAKSAAGGGEVGGAGGFGARRRGQKGCEGGQATAGAAHARAVERGGRSRRLPGEAQLGELQRFCEDAAWTSW